MKPGTTEAPGLVVPLVAVTEPPVIPALDPRHDVPAGQGGTADRQGGDQRTAERCERARHGEPFVD
ncbi:hypothetical protein [Lentzea sp. E54]|uniref:hypothetical protein n=1 Tax=Lentzea xerophila TaxID=3435883 RepID=UPI003DA2C238